MSVAEKSACMPYYVLTEHMSRKFLHAYSHYWVSGKGLQGISNSSWNHKKKNPMIRWMVLCFQKNPLDILVLFFQCVKAAELIGTFVNPKVSLKLITSAFKKTPKPSCIMVLTAVIRGSPKEILQPHLTDLGNMLSQAGVCQRSEEVRVIGKYTTVPSFRLVVLQLCICSP